MSVTPVSSEGWQRIAVFEFDAHAPIIESLRGNALDSCHLFLPARESPPGICRFELYVDFAIGDGPAIRLAQAQVEAVQQWAAAGMMPGFRFVSGREWIRPAAPPAGRRLSSVSSARDLH